jgi:hypothetical protein
MLGMGFVYNWSGLMAARWFLGVTEAGLFPGVNFYLSCWYKRNEFGVRAAIFFSAAALAGSFGGLLAAAIQNMDGIRGISGMSQCLSNCTSRKMWHTNDMQQVGRGSSSSKASLQSLSASSLSGWCTISQPKPDSYPRTIERVFCSDSRGTTSHRPITKTLSSSTFGQL